MSDIFVTVSTTAGNNVEVNTSGTRTVEVDRFGAATLQSEITTINNWTGASTGIYYPLTGNPANYVTGQVVRPSETGNFITSSQTGSFAANTGVLTGVFYSISNPSGYVSGNILALLQASGATGAAYNGSQYFRFLNDFLFRYGNELNGFSLAFNNPNPAIYAYLPINLTSNLVFSANGTNPTLKIGAGREILADTDSFRVLGNLSGVTGFFGRSGIGTGFVDSVVLQSLTLATTGSPNQYSTALNFSGNTWSLNTGVGLSGSQPMNWRIYESVASGNPPTSALNFDVSVTGSGYIGRMALSNLGELSVTGGVNLGGNLTLKSLGSVNAPYSPLLYYGGNAGVINLARLDAPTTPRIIFGYDGSNAGFWLPSNAVIAFGASTTASQVTDATLLRDAANTHAWRNGLNSQTGRIYSAYVNSSTGSWLEFATSTGAHQIMSVSSGTGLIPLQLGVNRSGIITIGVDGNTAITGNLTVSGSLNKTRSSTFDTEANGNDTFKVNGTTIMFTAADPSLRVRTRILNSDGSAFAPSYGFESSLGFGVYEGMWRVSSGLLGLARNVYVSGNLGVSNSNPTYTLDVGGSGNFRSGVNSSYISLNPSGISGSFTLDTNSFYFYTGIGASVWTMPLISTCIGRTYIIKNKSSSLTISGQGTDKLFTTTRVSTLVINSGESYNIINDGQDWTVY